MKLMAK